VLAEAVGGRRSHLASVRALGFLPAGAEASGSGTPDLRPKRLGLSVEGVQGAAVSPVAVGVAVEVEPVSVGRPCSSFQAAVSWAPV